MEVELEERWVGGWGGERGGIVDVEAEDDVGGGGIIEATGGGAGGGERHRGRRILG